MKKAILNLIFLGLISISILALLLISLFGTFQLPLGFKTFSTHHLNAFYVILVLTFILRELLNRNNRRTETTKNIVPLEKISSGSFRHHSIFIFISAISLLFFFSSLNNYFFMDDFIFINRVESVNNIKDILSFFTSPFPFGIFYRPVHLLSFLANYKIFGLNPTGYNLTNLLLHIFNLGLFYCLVFKITKSRSAAFFSVFIYILNFERYYLTVEWISARNDLIPALFCLLSLNLFVIWQDYSRRKYIYMLALFSWVPALLSKETSIILPLILISYRIVKGKDVYAKNYILDYVKLFLPFIIIGCIYFVLRFYAGGRMPVLGNDVYKYHLGINIFHNFIKYLEKTLIWSLVPFYLLLAYIPKIKKLPFPNSSFRIIIFGMLFFIFSLLPVIALPHTARQYFYLPTFGSSICLGILLNHVFVQFLRKDKFFAQYVLKNILIFSLIFLIPYVIMKNKHLKEKTFINKDILQELKEECPSLDKNSIIYFLDSDNVLKSYTKHFLPDAIKSFYNDDTLNIKIIYSQNQFSPEKQNTYLFYINGGFTEKRKNLYQFYPLD